MLNNKELYIIADNVLVFIRIPIVINTSSVSSLEGLTKEQAISQFGLSKVRKAIKLYLRKSITKIDLLSKLQQKHKFEKAISSLKNGSDGEYNYELFSATNEFYSTDVAFLMFLRTIGLKKGDIFTE